jgi:accessory gene regulator B
MEQAAGTLADILVKKHIVDSQDRDFYRYAIETVLVYAINLMTMFILAAVTGKLKELIFFLAVFYPLRTNSGGKHMKTWYTCYITSCIVTEVILLLSAKITMHIISIVIILAAGIICIYTLAPIEHKDHPMEEQDFKKSRIKVRIFSVCISIAAIILKYFGYETAVFICVSSVALCSVLLLLGVIEGKITHS